MVAIHITHEAECKIGGIGEYITGLISSTKYKDFFKKTYLLGPYIGMEEIKIEKEFEIKGAKVKRGKRFIGEEVEVFLTDVKNLQYDKEKELKDLELDIKDYGWDIEEYIRIAIVFPEILNIIKTECGVDEREIYAFSHEFMGIPSLLIAQKNNIKIKKIYISHEIPTIRNIVERESDIYFYNLTDEEKSEEIEKVYNPRGELVKKTVDFDLVIAVSKRIKEEYTILTGKDKAQVVYNSIRKKNVNFEDKEKIRKELLKILELEFEPDIILTHISRLIPSKGLWRDFILLKHLDELLQKEKLSAVYILVATNVKRKEEEEKIMKKYGWPKFHKIGWPDIIKDEEEIFKKIEESKNFKRIKAIFINQFINESLFEIIRISSDAEIGLSTYEPFGISHIEVLPYGGVPIVSSSSGCVDLLKEINAKFIEMDFIKEGAIIRKINTTKKTKKTEKEEIENIIRAIEERTIKNKIIKEISKIPKNKKERYINFISAPQISWENTAQKILKLIQQ